ncbi:MAG: hypothetical protein IKU43_08110, partial [Clostridia bacterium]|nr:hypothetical protein [Clostridia bacterium]
RIKNSENSFKFALQTLSCHRQVTDEGPPDLALYKGYPQRNPTITIALGTIFPFNPNVVIGVLGGIPYAEIM